MLGRSRKKTQRIKIDNRIQTNNAVNENLELDKRFRSLSFKKKNDSSSSDSAQHFRRKDRERRRRSRT